MKALGIIDSKTTYLNEKYTTIKLLHTTDLTKRILVKNVEDQNEDRSFCKEIKMIYVRD